MSTAPTQRSTPSSKPKRRRAPDAESKITSSGSSGDDTGSELSRKNKKKKNKKSTQSATELQQQLRELRVKYDHAKNRSCRLEHEVGTVEAQKYKLSLSLKACEKDKAELQALLDTRQSTVTTALRRIRRACDSCEPPALPARTEPPQADPVIGTVTPSPAPSASQPAPVSAPAASSTSSSSHPAVPSSGPSLALSGLRAR
jgi:hypothetical protein